MVAFRLPPLLAFAADTAGDPKVYEGWHLPPRAGAPAFDIADCQAPQGAAFSRLTATLFPHHLQGICLRCFIAIVSSLGDSRLYLLTSSPRHPQGIRLRWFIANLIGR